MTYEAPKTIVEEKTSIQQQQSNNQYAGFGPQGGYGQNVVGSGFNMGLGGLIGNQQSNGMKGAASSLSEVIYEAPRAFSRSQQRQQNLQFGGSMGGSYSQSYYQPPQTIVQETIQKSYSNDMSGGFPFPIQEGAQFKTEPLRPHQVTKTEYVVGGNNMGSRLDEMVS